MMAMSHTLAVVEIPEQLLSMQSHLVFQLGVFISSITMVVEQLVSCLPKGIETFEPNKSKDPGDHTPLDGC
jgi:hypothetical protein